MKEQGQLPDAPVHVSDWFATLQRADIILNWTCTTFRSRSERTLESDAQISVAVTSESGRINATTIKASDRTNFRARKKQADVSASITGVGRASTRLTIELMDKFAAADEYVTIVELNITAP